MRHQRLDRTVIPVPRNAVRALAAERLVRGQAVPYVLARLPAGMSTLAWLLFGHEHLGGYAGAGGLVAVNTTAVAVTTPMIGRLVDRRGPGRVLPAAIAVYIAGVIVALTHSTGLALYLGAAVAGATMPPSVAVLRSSWRALPAPARDVVFAVDATLSQAANITGPLLVSLAMLAGSPAAALTLAAVCVAAGGLGTAWAARGAYRSGRSRAMLASRGGRGWLGPLRQPAVLWLLSVVAVVTASIGLLEMAAVAFATSRHHSALGGVLLAAMSAGSVAGGLVYTAAASRVAPERALPWLCAVSVPAFCLLTVPGSAGWLVVTFALAGVASAPLFAAGSTLLSSVAAPGAQTETFTWMSTANFAAIGAGSAAGGVLVHGAGVGPVFVVAAAGMALAAGFSVRAARCSRPATNYGAVSAAANIL